MRRTNKNEVRLSILLCSVALLLALADLRLGSASPSNVSNEIPLLVASSNLDSQLPSTRDSQLSSDDSKSPDSPSLSPISTISVTNTNDSGPGSLRQAILDANANSGTDTIAFSISGSGVRTIAPTSLLPTITDPVIIDGYTQPGSSANTQQNGDNAVLLIELAGNAVTSGTCPAFCGGLTITSGNSVIRGLVINRFTGSFQDYAVVLQGSGGNVIEGNFIGTNPTGTAAAGSGVTRGIAVFSSSNNTIGGTTPSARNVISGNNQSGIALSGNINGASATNNQVIGNFIGTNAAGSAAIGNSFIGIFIAGVTSNNFVGGTSSGSGNVISGNGTAGIFVNNGATQNVVEGNLIGTNAAGTAAIGNSNGIILGQGTSSTNNIIGGSTPQARNIVSGNFGSGIEISGGATVGNSVQGNYVGTDISGNAPLPNSADGLLITGAAFNNTGGASSNILGGVTPGASNIIAFNGGNGVNVNTGSANSIFSNSIFANSGLGIRIGPGANNSQAPPILTSANSSGGNLGIQGTLSSLPNTTFRLEFFSNPACDSSGFGEGQTFLGSATVSTDTSGNASANLSLSTSVSGGAFVTATATDPNLNTSGFSACVQVSVVTPTPTPTPTSTPTPTPTPIPTPIPTPTSTPTPTATPTPGSSTEAITYTYDALNRLTNVAYASGGSISYSYDAAGNRTAIQTSGAPPQVQLSAGLYLVSEGAGRVDVTFARSGDTTSGASVAFATGDSAGLQNCNVINGLASSRCDYISALGTVTFAPGETSKTISILIVDDVYVEGNETFTISLSNSSGATLGTQSTATVMIIDNDSANGPNPIDQSGFFVDDHYADFLNRLADPSGRAFWANEIASCGTNQGCIEVKRINVSAAFFLSIEFQGTGYLVERIYKAAYGDAQGTSTFNGAHQFAVPIIRLNEFLPDTQEISQGLIVGQAGWETVLENNKQGYTSEFVQRSRFTTAFPSSMTAAQFVDKLNTNAGNPLSQSERDQLVNQLASGAKTRAQVLRAVAEDTDLSSAEFNRAFVLMQFFGYLRRNPNDPQDTDYTGYDFWLTKLNNFTVPGDDPLVRAQKAEMVKAFIVSTEYRQRFGP